jgi:hypothetical protein
MKRILFVSFLGVFVLGIGAAMAAAENYSGTWALDASKSQGLPQQAPTDQVWTVAQTAAEISIERPGMGRGGGGGGAAPAAQKAVYKLDGSETTEEGQRGKVTRKAKWTNGGKTLELNSVRNVNVQGNDMTLTTVEHWDLSDGGKTLKVHSKTDTPQGAREVTYVFTKK